MQASRVVYLHRHLPGAEDDHGNLIDAWEDPGQELYVYGWSAPQSTEPKLAGHDRVIVDQEVYGPPHLSPLPAPRDRMTVAGRLFNVVGIPEDYASGNPFGWQAGLVINLQAVEG